MTTTLDSFRTAVLIPFVDKLIEYIQSRFSDKDVAVVVAISVFNPANIPQADDHTFRTYENEEIMQLSAFYGEEAVVEFQGESFQFPLVIDGDVLLSEWPVFRRALIHVKEAFLSSKELTKTPTFQQLFQGIQKADAYCCIYPEMFKLINIMFDFASMDRHR